MGARGFGERPQSIEDASEHRDNVDEHAEPGKVTTV